MAKVVLAHVPYIHRGGEDRHVELLQTVYERLGYDCIYAPQDRTAPGMAVEQALRSLSPKWRSNRHCQRLDQLWKSGGISHIHLHNLYPALGTSFLRWAIDRQVPLVMTVHNHRFFCANGLALRDGKVCKDCFSNKIGWRPALFGCNDTRSKSIYYGAALTDIRENNLLDQAVRVYIAPSPYIANELVRFGMDPSKVIFLPNPIEFDKKVTAQPELGKKKYHDFFYAGRLSEEKGIAQLIDVARSMPQNTFRVAGDGPLGSWLESQILSEVSNVRYLGALSASQVLDEIAASEVCVLPSICNEILPTFVLEAFLSGKKCVVPRRESTLWLAEAPFWGMAAEPSDVQQFKVVLEQATSAPEPTLDQLQLIRKQFDLGTYGSRLKEILKFR